MKTYWTLKWDNLIEFTLLPLWYEENRITHIYYELRFLKLRFQYWKEI